MEGRALRGAEASRWGKPLKGKPQERNRVKKKPKPHEAEKAVKEVKNFKGGNIEQLELLSR